MAETVSVTIKKLTKKYKETVAVDNLNLEINEREFFILLGPSGCGKSTALLCLAGLLRPDNGEIQLGDKLVTSIEHDVYVPPQDRGVAMVFQDYALYPHMTVYHNIAFPLEVRGKNKNEIEVKTERTAKLLGISNLLERKPKQLSGGQRQRVALGRAIIREPKLFLLDEPLANLDAKLRIRMRAELKKLHQGLGTTTIYVTHDQIEALSIGDRIAVLKDGILQQVGRPEEIYDSPRNMFVAGFIGSPPMNVLEGTIIKRDGNIGIDLGIAIFELPDKVIKAVKDTKSSDVVLGIRPEHITFVEKNHKNAIEAKVNFLELMGRELHVHLTITMGEKSIIAITEPTQHLEIDQQVWFTFDEHKVHIFDKKTEEAII